MRRISPVLVLLLGSLVGVASSCDSGDEGIGNKPSDDKEDGGNDESDDGDDGETSSASTSSTTSGTATATSAATSASTSTATSGSSGVTSDSALPAGTAIGIGCDDNTDCIAPLTCLRENESFRGAFPGTGICTMPCTSDATCLAVDTFGICAAIGAPTEEDVANAGEDALPNGVAGYCMQACYYGDPVEKCGELPEFTCAPTSDTITTSVLLGICLPLCYEDANCQDGEHCDTGSGLCVPENGEGKAVGDDCDPSAEDPGCAEGYCVAMTETVGFCTTNCTVRPETIICNGAEPGPDAKATCYANIDVYFGTDGAVLTSYGDLGQCWPLCDEDADCPTGLVCDISSEDAQAVTGRQGLCFLPAEAADAGAADASTPEETSSDVSTGDGG